LVYSVEAERKTILQNDEIAKQLLKVIATRHLEGKSLIVTKAMLLDDIAAAITIHRKLSRMIRIGLIEKKFIGTDFRRKYLVPTKLYLDYLKFNSITGK